MSNLELAIEIVRRTPLWVWALLAALLLLGLSQLRERRVAGTRLWILPAVLLSLGLFSTATSFVPAWPALGAWAIALAAGSALGARLPAPARAAWDAHGRTLHLPGSMLPLLIIVALFVLRYAGGVALVMHPGWRSAPGVALPMAATYGAIAGVLLGRVRALHRHGGTTMLHHAAHRPA